MTTTVTAKTTGYPAWSRIAEIGDYGGSADKRASVSEGETPYTYQVYRELQAGRGSAYTKESGTLVHVENLALARALSEVYFRKPERVRANGVPASSDERLEYWVTVLGVPRRLNEQRWQLRTRCAAHYAAAKGPSYQNVYAACQELLGDVFVGLQYTVGDNLDEPPDYTYWPGVDPGPSTYSLGRGAWTSVRCHLLVQITRPPSISESDLHQLLNVQLFQMLDRMLPAWADFSWGETDTAEDGSGDEGFILGVSELGFASL